MKSVCKVTVDYQLIAQLDKSVPLTNTYSPTAQLRTEIKEKKNNPKYHKMLACPPCSNCATVFPVFDSSAELSKLMSINWMFLPGFDLEAWSIQRLSSCRWNRRISKVLSWIWDFLAFSRIHEKSKYIAYAGNIPFYT